MEIPDELNALLAAMKLTGKEPAWKFSASTDQVTVQLKGTRGILQRRYAKRYDQWVQAKSSAATSAEVIPHTTKVDQNQQTEAKTARDGSREIVPTKYQGEPEGIVIKTDTVISPYNPRKACHRQYYLQSTKDRGKRCRIDFDERFDSRLSRVAPDTTTHIATIDAISRGSYNSTYDLGTARYTLSHS
ncbi:unnamed protein product [Mytilus edulis]|uniref:Uncharacterized protein n=1 Tax=Mytilus edulis TaxID=6550 RepID=A0A8S3VH22_MYTED|nr:unnamed protein product [Mytilus edulis]